MTLCIHCGRARDVHYGLDHDCGRVPPGLRFTEGPTRAELEARIAELEAALSELNNAATDYFLEHGAEHEYNDCPEDDTCCCPLINALNEAAAKTLRVLPEVRD